MPLLGARDVDQLPPRIQRFRIRLMWFDFKITHVPGKELYTADTLSRAPGREPSNADMVFQTETSAFVNLVHKSLPASDQRLESIRSHQWEDDVLREILTYVQEGWPDRSQIKGIAKKYLPYQSDLTTIDDLLLMGTRIVIPSSLRPDILSRLHEGHQGITKCRQLARDAVWWPGVGSDIEDLIKGCHQCQKKSTNNLEPLIPSPVPQQALHKIATDLFHIGKDNYIVVVDFYSRYPEYAKLESTTSSTVISHMKSIFARHGIPKVVCSDNWPQYSSIEFADFSRSYGFTHVTSSPGHPSGNGEAERAVRTVKELVKQADPYIALLNYRNTPIRNGFSPAELLMNRKLNTKIPILPQKLNPNPPDMTTVQQRVESYRMQMKSNFDKRHSTHNLTDLRQGDEVWIKDRNETGSVMENGNHERSFVISTPKGTFTRNRIQLSKLPSKLDDSVPSDDITSSSVSAPDNSAKPATTPDTSGDSRQTRCGRKIMPPIRYRDK